MLPTAKIANSANSRNHKCKDSSEKIFVHFFRHLKLQALKICLIWTKFIELVPALIFPPKLEFFNLILVIRDFGDIVANTGNCKQTAGILLFTAMQMISFGKSYFHINFYLALVAVLPTLSKVENTKLEIFCKIGLNQNQNNFWCLHLQWQKILNP